MEVMRERVLARQKPEVNAILKDATVAIIGCGGLGSNIAMMLTRCGVGHLILADYDRVDWSNLNRQNYTWQEVGECKVEKTRERLLATVPYVRVDAKVEKVDADTLELLLAEGDLFIEAVDDAKTKAWLFDAFLAHPEKTLITASGLSGLGNLEDIQIRRYRNVTLIGDFRSSPEEGLYLPYVSIVASLEALEAIKILQKQAKSENR